MKLCITCNVHYKDEGANCPADGAKLVEVGNDPLLGKTIGDRYRVLHIIGRGSMGIVYKALQISTGREMAVKFLLQTGSNADPGESMVKRFQREAKTLSSLKHPNIVTLFDFGFIDETKPYLVTEFLYGLTLTQFLRQNGFIDPRKALPIFQQVCDAVKEAHHHKVVHRDVKPDNIFLQGKDAGGRFIKVLDFGIAKLLDARATTSLTMDGRVCGSPAYMSPEQCKAIDVDYRCDIYSLAVVIFETLTGRRPFDGVDAMSVMFAHVNEQAPSLISIRNDPLFTPELEAVLQKALHKEPTKRQQSMDAFWEELSDAVMDNPKKGPSMAGWIAFPTASKKTTAISALQAGLDWDMIQAASKPQKKTMYLHEFRRKQRLFFARVALAAGLLIGGYMLLENHRDKTAGDNIDLLMMQGRFPVALRLMEKRKLSHAKTAKWSADDDERLNNLYVKSAEKYIKDKQYKQAVEQLQKVQSESKYSPEAKGLLKKYKKFHPDL